MERHLDMNLSGYIGIPYNYASFHFDEVFRGLAHLEEEAMFFKVAMEIYGNLGVWELGD